jgi:hypothetical protein
MTNVIINPRKYPNVFQCRNKIKYPISFAQSQTPYCLSLTLHDAVALSDANCAKRFVDKNK